MAEGTAISWATDTFNPWIGCERVSPACAHCYADTFATNRMGKPGLWEPAGPRHITGDSTWNQPRRWNRKAEESGVRRRVFCASMADVFEDRPDLEEPRERLFELIYDTPMLDWLLLTKRPEFARDWLRRWYEREDDWGRMWAGRQGIPWGVLPNVWVGVSVENESWTWRADVLREIPCVIRFISAEPLLGSLLEPRSRGRTLGAGRPARGSRSPLDLDGIDWLIVGGESGGHEARPMHPSWARELRDAAKEREIPFHFKQWGSWSPANAVEQGRLCGLELNGLVVPPEALTIEGALMAYRGASSKAGGKLLDGTDYCEIPTARVYA